MFGNTKLLTLLFYHCKLDEGGERGSYKTRNTLTNAICYHDSHSDENGSGTLLAGIGHLRIIINETNFGLLISRHIKKFN